MALNNIPTAPAVDQLYESAKLQALDPNTSAIVEAELGRRSAEDARFKAEQERRAEEDRALSLLPPDQKKLIDSKISEIQAYPTLPTPSQASGLQTPKDIGVFEGKQQLIADEYSKKAAAIEKSSLEKQSRFDLEFQKLDKELNNLKNQNIDASSYWDNKSTGQKVLAGIALFLGSAGQNGNSAATVIQNAINKDIEIQEKNRQLKLQNIQGKQNILSNMYSIYKDGISAKLATQAALLDKAKMQTDIWGEKVKTDELKIKAGTLSSELEGKKLSLMKDLAARMSHLNLASKGEITQEEFDISSLDLSPEQEQGLRERIIRVPSPDPSGGFKIGFADNKVRAEKFNEYSGEVYPALQTVNKLINMTKENKNIAKLPLSQLKAEIQTEIAGLLGQLRLSFTGPGALTDKERESLKEAIGDPTKIFSIPANSLAKLGAIKSKLERDINFKAQQAGLKKAYTGNARISSLRKE